jgi:hypothetical protein
VSSAARVLFLAFLLSGCSRPAPEDTVSAILDGNPLPRGAAPGIVEHNFGAVLARGQSLKHQFTFTNSTDRPIRLTGASATTPCCSGVGPISGEPIPPGGQCAIPVVLKAVADNVEEKRVGFLVRTDSDECPTLTYALRATFYPEIDIHASADSCKILPIGRAGRQALQIACFRLSGDNASVPTQVAIDPPLAARFAGEPREQRWSDGVATVVRDVEISLPSSSELGTHQGNLVLRWPDGRTQERVVL